jgi:hypothetical protein
MSESILNDWWAAVQSLDSSILVENASSLCSMHQVCQILDLPPLPVLSFPEIHSSDLLSRKPAFKTLSTLDILFLRKCLIEKEARSEIYFWGEYLLRYLEINRPILFKKASHQFGSPQAGRIALLELCALMMDIYFETNDLRYLNITLKMLDMPRIFSLGPFSQKQLNQLKKLPLILIQVRLMAFTRAAIYKIKI